MFESDSGYDMDGLTMDDKYRLFRDGKLVNRDYYNWMDYWMDYHNITDPISFVQNNNQNGKPLGRDGWAYAYYMGEDAAGNIYWCKQFNNSVTVFNEQGWCFEEIEYQSSSFLPTVHPNGDIYFMKWGEEQNSVDLYKIPNTWAPIDWQPPTEEASSNPTATVTANGLRMRDNPATSNSSVVGELTQGTTVEILGQSANEETISNKTAYWYRVKTSDGLDG
jgi:hypothetical protein